MHYPVDGDIALFSFPTIGPRFQRFEGLKFEKLITNHGEHSFAQCLPTSYNYVM